MADIPNDMFSLNKYRLPEGTKIVISGIVRARVSNDEKTIVIFEDDLKYIRIINKDETRKNRSEEDVNS